MKTRLFTALLALTLLFSGCVAAVTPTNSSQAALSAVPSGSSAATTDPPPAPQTPPDLHEAGYRGVKGDGRLSKADKATFPHLFFQDGAVIALKIASDKGFSIQNQLIEGQIYLLETDGEALTGISALTPPVSVLPKDTQVYAVSTAAGGAAVETVTLPAQQAVWTVGTNYYALPAAAAYVPPVCGIPGLKTLKNFLATALMPVGTTLYVYGGGWNWQDDGASLQATTLGLPESWVQFFQSQDESYRYRSDAAAASYFPTGGWNQYYYAGADCSGYLGWAVYNTLETQSGLAGYVGPSTNMAGSLADRGLGALVSDKMLPGDILSMNGHVYISLGTCPDGSVLILHATPATTGGAGVQLSAIGSGKNCQAYALANQYMNQFYPQWAKRYGHQVLCFSPGSYAPKTQFRWSILNDPEGLAAMAPEQILNILFSA